MNRNSFIIRIFVKKFGRGGNPIIPIREIIIITGFLNEMDFLLLFFRKKMKLEFIKKYEMLNRIVDTIELMVDSTIQVLFTTLEIAKRKNEFLLFIGIHGIIKMFIIMMIMIVL